VSFAVLALISAVAVLGPVLAIPRGLHLPVVLGELIAGLVLGRTGFSVLQPGNPMFAFLASIGFSLVMFVAGTHVPIRDPQLRGALRIGVLRAVAVGVIAAPLAWLIAIAFGTGHVALYTVLLASSSAALVLPIVDSLGLSGANFLQLLPQVAIADAACVVALPLAIDPSHAGRAALGAAAVIAASALFFVILRRLERTGFRRRVHRISEQRKFALEMRVNLVMLFSLSALAVATHVSILLAGFCFGLAVAAAGEPRRLARQTFALTEGFLGPLFFVWLGATLDVRELLQHPVFIAVGAALGLGAVGAHVAMRSTGQPLAFGGLAAAQLGVPIGAVTIGAQLHKLAPGESAAIFVGALLTIAIAVWSGAVAARTDGASPSPGGASAPLP
jgi:Kef-type K+ transport system membrane component KefB